MRILTKIFEGFEARVARLLGFPGAGEALAEITPEVMRRCNMPMGRKVVTSGLTDTLERSTQRAIRIERLILSSSALGGFDVTNINFGVQNLYASIGNVPSELFSLNAVNTKLRGNVLNCGMRASVGVQNHNKTDESIGGCFFGELLQG